MSSNPLPFKLATIWLHVKSAGPRRRLGPGELLPWAWAAQRLTAARTYWIATTRPDGRPHTRPVWGVWLEDGLWPGRRRPAGDRGGHD
ncbi:pyridoxamine 5'-phosphate oxidase family protein [Streptomyces durmitorensis]|uniref:Pyridoxamine 5'-phosphate oxidase family protein n=1 Tax=Streptomyces durmitorensis TaxID=319947 RepID=A0ABY4PUF2_9ACTN|nr:pyridoxamine 5'-phosphate oxidase family protein [Streptomyces durmitorensis]UQT57067.1 pyridoxamine 5'-phosphate oxidase family protein [Streptomyces durmitorensis]